MIILLVRRWYGHFKIHDFPLFYWEKFWRLTFKSPTIPWQNKQIVPIIYGKIDDKNKCDYIHFEPIEYGSNVIYIKKKDHRSYSVVLLVLQIFMKMKQPNYALIGSPYSRFIASIETTHCLPNLHTSIPFTSLP